MQSLTRIENAYLSIDVSSLGAEMQSIAARDGTNWLWNGDAAFWTGRSPVLFPIDLFPEDWRWTLWLNPMTAFVLAYQDILLKGAMPSLQLWGVILLWTAAIVALLEPVLKHSKDQLIDWL